MKSFLLSVLVLGSVSAIAEVKPRGTILADHCGWPSKTLTVCTATAVGTNTKYITLSTVKSQKKIVAKARVIGPGLVLWSGNLGGKPVSLTVHIDSNGRQTGTYKVDGKVVGLAPFTMQMQFHTQAL